MSRGVDLSSLPVADEVVDLLLSLSRHKPVCVRVPKKPKTFRPYSPVPGMFQSNQSFCANYSINSLFLNRNKISFSGRMDKIDMKNMMPGRIMPNVRISSRDGISRQRTITKKGRVYKKCIHGKSNNGYFCRECGGAGLCIHGSSRYKCLDCGGKVYSDKKCAHLIPRSQCLLCKPMKKMKRSKKCPHNRQRSKCVECGGKKYVAPKCIHGRQRSRCVPCGGQKYVAPKCVHGRQKSRCVDCGGKKYVAKKKSARHMAKCIHNIEYSLCRECSAPRKRKRVVSRSHLFKRMKPNLNAFGVPMVPMRSSTSIGAPTRGANSTISFSQQIPTNISGLTNSVVGEEATAVSIPLFAKKDVVSV
eukprot:g3294.t1